MAKNDIIVLKPFARRFGLGEIPDSSEIEVNSKTSDNRSLKSSIYLDNTSFVFETLLERAEYRERGR